MIALTAEITILDVTPQTISVDYSVLQDIEAKHAGRADNEKPSYGIISNSGSMTFADNYGKIKDYAERKLLKPDLKVYIFLKDTISGKSVEVGNYETSDWDYDTANREVTVQFKDSLEELQEINHDGIDLARDNDGNVIKSKTAKDLYNDLLLATPSKYNFPPFDSLDRNTRMRLGNTIIQFYYLESGKLWQQWTKLCELAQANIWQGFVGNTIFKAV